VPRQKNANGEVQNPKEALYQQLSHEAISALRPTSYRIIPVLGKEALSGSEVKTGKVNFYSNTAERGHWNCFSMDTKSVSISVVFLGRTGMLWRMSGLLLTAAGTPPVFRRSMLTIAVPWCFRRILDPANASCDCLSS
jgi:hypothetical protein